MNNSDFIEKLLKYIIPTESDYIFNNPKNRMKIRQTCKFKKKSTGIEIDEINKILRYDYKKLIIPV